MKITINGEGFTTASIQPFLDDLEKEYGLKIRDVTIYARFVDEQGRVVEPKLPGDSNELTKTIPKSELPKDPEPSEPVSLEEMMDILKLPSDQRLMKTVVRHLTDLQELDIDRKSFVKAYETTILNTGKLSFPYLKKLLEGHGYKKSNNLEPSEPISIEGMINVIQKQTGKLLNEAELKSLVFLYNLEIDKETFETALHKVLEAKPNFAMRYFEKIALDLLEKRG